MKRLAAIMAGALLTTVGGVYAQFTYPQDNVNEQVISAQKTLQPAATDTKKGTINVTGDFTVSIVDDNNDFITETTILGNLTISFSPAKGADAEVRDNGIPLKMTIVIGNPNKYDNKALFELTSAYTDGGVALNGGNRVKDAVSVNLTDYIKWNDDEFTLSTLAEYNAFKEAFENTTITVTVSEAK